MDIDYLVEMLLYSQYYLQANMAVDCIVSALTDLNTWHIFVLVYALELKHYYTCSEMDITPNGIFAFLSQIKHAFNFIICHKTWRARYGYRYEWYGMSDIFLVIVTSVLHLFLFTIPKGYIIMFHFM